MDRRFLKESEGGGAGWTGTKGESGPPAQSHLGPRVWGWLLSLLRAILVHLWSQACGFVPVGGRSQCRRRKRSPGTLPHRKRVPETQAQVLGWGRVSQLAGQG